jgi:hypothetical protein
MKLDYGQIESAFTKIKYNFKKIKDDFPYCNAYYYVYRTSVVWISSNYIILLQKLQLKRMVKELVMNALSDSLIIYQIL